MKKHLLLILLILSSLSLMAIGTENGSTKDFIPDEPNIKTSIRDEAFDVFDSGTSEHAPCMNAIPISLGETVTVPANEDMWYALDITEVHETQQEFRWTFTNLSDKEANINLAIYPTDL